ncbi:hypothetical protein [Mucilaginibacter celer]|nr:hypothetical protein [Mucilaginibacter celer]
MHSIATTMHSMIPASVKPSVTYFRYGCFLMVLSTILISISLADNLNNPTLTAWLLVTGSLVYLVSFTYVCSFSARMVESMLQGEILGNSDSLKGILCFWIYPIGLWYVQPAVRRILAQYDKQIV